MKAKNILMSVLAAGCLSVACFAEAASVALLPLIDNSDYENKEELNTAYNAAVIRTVNSVEGFTLVDNDNLTSVLDKYLEDGILPDEATMQKIATEAGVDVIFAMELRTLKSDTVLGKYDDRVILDLDGRAVSYNALIGKFQNRRVKDDNTVPMDTVARSNFELESFTNNVRREMGKVLGNKKIKIDKARFGW